MKPMRIVFACLWSALLGMSLHVSADDIDIYSGLGAAAGIPNVLIVFDNAADFSSNAGGSSCTIKNYSTGVTGTNSLSGTEGGVEQCAFYNVLANLQPNSDGTARVNVGFMVYNANNIKDYQGANCQGSNGGCLVYPLTAMTGSTQTNLLSWITTWQTSSSGPGSYWIKASGEATAATVQEAWAYYAGQTGLSGRSYAGIAPAAGCQKNFVIFIGNSFGSNSTPGDGGSASPATALSNAPNITSALTNAITIPSGTYPDANQPPFFSCGSYSMKNHTDSSGLYADEWTRYMNQADLYSTLSGTQGIVTYTIGLLGTACSPIYPALLTSMATYGGGKSFFVSDYAALVSDLMKILNEVQAVNSVFSSSSLPVSVNAQGTYLNQIYMGMFRPDASANPRWAGNLKQYSFILTGTAPNQTLMLGDAVSNAALSSSGTGFLSPNAISYWTCTSNISSLNSSLSLGLTSTQLGDLQNCGSDPVNGFWLNNGAMVNSAGHAFDLPDGEWVEKGGAAQQLRLANLTASYPTSSGGTDSPRKLYTYCPSGASCNADLTTAGNAFKATNSGITASLFGSSTSVGITGITRSNNTATVTTSGNHGFSTGDSITITGATPDDYNGTYTITVTSGTQFTYSVAVTPATPATGTITASVPGNILSGATITRSGTTATVTLANHGFISGQKVTIGGANQSEYNGTFTISSVTTNTFQYTVTENPVTAAGTYGTSNATATADVYQNSSKTYASTTVNIVGVTANPPGVSRTAGSTTVTVTTTINHNFTTTQGHNSVTLSGVKDASGNTVTAYNGVFTISGIPTNKTFTFAISSTSPTTPATGNIAVSTPSASQPVTSIVRNDNTATVTAPSHGYLSSENVTIAGADQSAYNGIFAISNVTTNTFDYTVATTPTTPASGTMTASKGTSPDLTTLINWVRGQDNFGDEPSLCPPGTAAGTGNCPSPAVTIRPYVHGDVLHSRPTVINYGGSTGVVVYYGDNSGVFHAVDGNQLASSDSNAGHELWGFIPSELFGRLNRQRTNSPQLLLPSTPPGIVPAPQKKDYFVDGPSSVYQLMNSDGTTNKAYIYLAMRRGGQFIYALDVTTPTTPKYLWKGTLSNTINSASGSTSSELGLTWSTPKVARVRGWSNPVLIFGAGYDINEDNSPLASYDSMGRGIFVLDAITGAVVWSASSGSSNSCGGNATHAYCLVAGMNYAIPSDVTLVDTDSDGYINRLYVGDTGGNIWRVDLEPNGHTAAGAVTTPDAWRVYQLAALGCSSGACSLPSNQRKFFYPPEVIATSTYMAVIAGSGDREHPLATSSSDALFLLKDTHTGNSAAGMTAITQSNLFDATNTAWDGSLNGYYLSLASGEKVVNAPLVTAGFVYFGTNKPVPPSATSCTSNLGEARGYQLQPFTGLVSFGIFQGGGLPPSPVSGIVNIATSSGGTVQVPFLIGGGGGGTLGTLGDSSSAGGGSALGGQKPTINVSTNRIRTYWYQQGK